MSRYDPSRSIFAGMPQQQLQEDLNRAQRAYSKLLSGEKEVSLSYTQGDGSKSVTYTQTNMANLVVLIKQLQAQLGIVHAPRRPIRFWFR